LGAFARGARLESGYSLAFESRVISGYLGARLPTQEATMSNALKAGTAAPAFSLPSTPDQKVSLSEFRGRPVVLVFYPADWSPVCGDQLALYNELREDFDKLDATLLAISVDGAWCHLAFAKDRGYHLSLLSDFEPKGEVARRYGVYRDQDGFTERALFVIDGEGIIRWSYVSPVGVNPGADGILRALEALPKRGS
jgi:peroxiredoxin